MPHVQLFNFFKPDFLLFQDIPQNSPQVPYSKSCRKWYYGPFHKVYKHTIIIVFKYTAAFHINVFSAISQTQMAIIYLQDFPKYCPSATSNNLLGSRYTIPKTISMHSYPVFHLTCPASSTAYPSLQYSAIYIGCGFPQF